MSFVVTIERSATYRLVPEDAGKGAGINVPYLLGDMTGSTALGRVDVPLRAKGVATYADRHLVEIIVPDGWRVEQWPEGIEADDEVVRQFLAELD